MSTVNFYSATPIDYVQGHTKSISTPGEKIGNLKVKFRENPKRRKSSVKR